MTVKKQHFVPRFYLDNFAYDLNKIWVFDKPEGKIFSTTITDIACERYFYDDDKLDEHHNKNQFLENYYSEIESNFAPFYKSFLSKIKNYDKFVIMPDDRKIISEYLVTQIDRTKEHREEVSQFDSEIYQQLLEKGFSENQLLQMGYNETEMNKKELHLESIMAGNNLRNSLSEILADHIWTIYKNETHCLFYTSDQPIVKNGHIKDELYSNEGFASPGIEIAFPLTPQYILLLYDSEYFSNLISLDGRLLSIDKVENVDYYNSLQVCSSYRQIFSYDRCFELIDKIKKNAPSVFDLNRKRIG